MIFYFSFWLTRHKFRMPKYVDANEIASMLRLSMHAAKKVALTACNAWVLK